MGFKLAIEDKVCVTMRGKISAATPGQDKRFHFTLTMTRMFQQDITDALQSMEDMVDFLLARAHGWEGQRLVLTDDGQPAMFSELAFRAMLNIPGMKIWIWQSYVRDCGVQEKN